MTLKEKTMSTALKVAPINGGTIGVQPAKIITPKLITPIKEVVQETTPAIEPTNEAHSLQEQGIQTNTVVGTSSLDLSALSYDEVKNLALSAVGKINAIKSELLAIFLERDEVIEDLMRALVSGQHILMLGPPGTGKSNLADELTSRIESARIFKWLFNKTDDPSAVIGPISIKNLDRDKFIRKLDDKIADSEIAFADEIFKSNGPTLNSMLPILNERIVYNDGKAVKVPLKMMIAASNEVPDDDEGLEALYDRILFKHWVDYIKDPGNREKMMTMYNNKKNPFKNNTNTTKTSITLEEIDVLQYFKNAIDIPKNVMTAFGKLLNTLDKQGIKYSDRKINWCWDVMKSTALIAGRTAVDHEDIQAVTYILWEDKRDIDFIRQETNKLINPHKQKIQQYYAESNELINHVKELEPHDRKRAAEEILEVKTKVEIILSKMDKVIKSATNDGRDTTELKNKRDEINTSIQELVYSTFKINPTNPLDETAELPF